MGARAESEQLSFEVGFPDDEHPLVSTFRVSGEFSSLHQELLVGTDVQVIIVDTDGAVVVSSYGRVAGVGFHRHDKKNQPTFVERTHKLKLTDPPGEH